MMADLMVRLTGVTKRFGHAWALRGIDLEVKRGRCVGIFGANGAGKTTLLKILSTLSQPSGGSVAIAGYDALRQADKVRPLLGVLGHRTFLYSDLTARENLQFYGRMFGVEGCDDRVMEILQAVELEHQASQYVRTYSRGMQQRLAIARVLLHKPSLLLLDEPYTGLDQHAVKRLQDLLHTVLRTDNRTIILSTHDLQHGLRVCDEIVIQSRGKIVYQGAVADLDITAAEQLYLDYVK